MAAVLPFLETEQFHFPTDVAEGTPNGLGGLAGKKPELTAQQLVAASNVEQTRLLWTRTVLHEKLKDYTFQLALSGNDIKIVLSDKFDKDTIPWANTSQDLQNFSLFSSNSKMRCPTFDLPAGGLEVGGACPAAAPAQTTSIGRGVPPAESNLLIKEGKTLRLRLLPDIKYSLAKSVCSACYATGGRYGDPTVQIGEMVRYAVVRAASTNPTLREAFIEAVVWQIPRLPYDRLLVEDDKGSAEQKAEIVRRMNEKYPEKVVRIHSSGDFFSAAYAKMWLEIARRVHQQHGMKYRLWAPTRTHVVPGMVSAVWSSVQIPPNFTIRPSAYHIGDPAPRGVNMAEGTSVLDPDQSVEYRGAYYDHQCGVYDLGRGEKACVSAKPPNATGPNDIGCRACWLRPDLRVNYVAH